MRLVLPLALLAFPAFGQTAEPSSTAATYGNWTVNCVQADQGKTCQMVTRLNLKGNDGQLRPLLELAIGRPPAGGDLRIVMQVPMDVALREPFSLAAGQGPEAADQAPLLEASFFACLPSGCIADAVLEGAALKALRGASHATIGFTVLNGNKKFGVPVALDGFADAFAALGEAAE